MKACESCSQRVEIGANHRKINIPQRAVGIILVYLPLFTFPFVIIGAYLTYFHLRMLGATNLKTWSDFLPDRATHRYDLKSQVIMQPTFKFSMAKYRLFWIFNCTWYCPLSAGLLEWHAYLVKVVENWWCPFTHNRKVEGAYNEAAVDKSFWHLYPEDIVKLHVDDLKNPLWNQEEEKK